MEIHENSNQTKSFNSILKEYLLKMESKPFNNAIRTGFMDFDDLFGGFHFGELVVIGARPNMSQTEVMINLSLNISMQRNVLFFSLERNMNQISHIYTSLLSNFRLQSLVEKAYILLQKDFISERELDLIMPDSQEFKLFFNDRCENSITELLKCIELEIKTRSIEVVFIDSLELINRASKGEKSSIAFELKRFAQLHDICIITFCSLNKSVELRTGANRPMLIDLKSKLSIEDYADKIILLYKACSYGFTVNMYGESTEGIIEFIMAKNSMGKLSVSFAEIKEGHPKISEIKRKISTETLRKEHERELRKEAQSN